MRPATAPAPTASAARARRLGCPRGRPASASAAAAAISSRRRRRPDAYPAAAGIPTDATEEASRESVTVTVRFRPLSQREIRLGEEIAWYAAGDTTVRSEQNSTVAYAYDRVFGPTATTRHVYDTAAQHVVSGAMKGINGAIFTYGVTSSGKTHTMHGDQGSPGIIPLAVKDAFNIIQETPNRMFLLRVSYLEIYNEVVNDLLNPSGQNLRIREDHQGTFVVGIKEEVVLSPAHALSLIAVGEENRHVGSTNFNLLSSRSHTIFTLTIESSPGHESNEGEAVSFSQLNLVDLAGSESSRAETTGVRRKEGSYINKSLLTLGTVISKLTDGKGGHVPFRDSKLTRLLQSSLSGQGRVSLICTITPVSSNSEETHNTLKFAHRAKHIEVQAVQNKIMDEKSLIKKYQNEIHRLKEELHELKRGLLTGTLNDSTEDSIILWKQKLEDGNIKLQSRLEQEEATKVALLARIQRLTELILVSTKVTQIPTLSQRHGPRRSYSFGEEELACLPYRRQDIILETKWNHSYVPMEVFNETLEISSKGEKKIRKGLLNWFKLQKYTGGSAALISLNGDQSSLKKEVTAHSRPSENRINFPLEQTIPNSFLCEDLLSDEDEEIQFDSLTSEEAPSVNGKTIGYFDLLKEQIKILSGEVALHTSVLKRLAEQAARSTTELIEMEMEKVSDEIKGKNHQIAYLKRHIKGTLDQLHLQVSHAELLEPLNEKAFELELKTADNRIIQDQLKQTTTRCQELQGKVALLKEQLSEALEANEMLSENIILQNADISHEVGSHDNTGNQPSIDVSDELHKAQQSEIAELNRRLHELAEAKNQLEARYQKLLEESMHAKDLASAAGVKLKELSGQVSKLMKRNERLASELASARNSAQPRAISGPKVARNSKWHDSAIRTGIHGSYEREEALEVMLMEKGQREAELQKKIEESKQKEAFLEGDRKHVGSSGKIEESSGH